MIYRVHKKNDYTMINNYLIKDKNLNLKDKGMLLVLLSLPDNWDFSVMGLMTLCKESKNTINDILNNLEKYNYLERNKIYENGRIKDWRYDIYEIPKKLYLKNQDIEIQDIDFLDIENYTQLNTNKESTKELNTNNKEIYKESIEKIINYLNNKIDTHYKTTTPKTKQLITARLNEGFTVEDFIKVIDNKYSTWFKDKKMCTYLRPETLFGTKFENYLNEKVKKRLSDEELIKMLEEME
jgi:uncharacterized phage protein (TIGR02220 family)